MKTQRVAVAVALVVGAMAAGEARAVDGVIEINQAKALAGGVTGTDGGGFPVTIDKGGSYRLTSNLVVPADTNGIVVSIIGASADPSIVDIDLNGFTISGTVSCSFGMNLNCTATAGPGYGIQAVVGQMRAHDGVVQGFRSHCIDNSITGRSILLRNLDLKWCSFGANVHQGVVENVNAYQNQTAGIFASRSILYRIHSQENAGDGILIAESTLEVCSSSYNLNDGINAGNKSLIRNCASFANLGYGLRCAATGIDSSCGYAGNNFYLNNSGSVVNGTELGPNLCGPDTTCP